MRNDDLRTLAEIGIAIWGDPDISRRTTMETVAAVSLLDLSGERTVERVASVLLERASRAGVQRHADTVGAPFYRLTAEERFVLIVLHVGRWSYERISRVLDEPTEKIEEIAWSARVKLYSKSPAGAKAVTPYCPEYLRERPWTQRFLDEEIKSGSDRLFLQNHLMACDSCRAALGRCRELYFSVEAMLPRETAAGEFAEVLSDARTEGRKLTGLEMPSIQDSLIGFFKRTDVLIVLGIVLVFLIFKFK